MRVYFHVWVSYFATMATGLLTDKVGFLRVAAENTARELETKSLVIECDVSQ